MQPNKGYAYTVATRIPHPHKDIHSTSAQQRSFFSKYESLTRSLMKKRVHRVEGAKKYACQRPAGPLNKPIRHDVQCRDRSVMDCLLVRSHPNKVSMEKKRRRGRGGGSESIYTRSSTLVASEIHSLVAYWFALRWNYLSVGIDCPMRFGWHYHGGWRPPSPPHEPNLGTAST